MPVNPQARRGGHVFLTPDVVPSLYAADHDMLVDAALACAAAGTLQFHVDMMDGRFVPAVGLSLKDVRTIRAALPEARLHVHLMVADPEREVEALAQAKMTSLTFHVEGMTNPKETLARARELGLGVGLALRPETVPACLADLCNDIDSILVMLANPGRPNQMLIPAMFAKIREVRALYPDAVVVADGCLDEDTIPTAFASGADIVVCGRSLFAAPPGKTLPRLRCLLPAVRMSDPGSASTS